MRGARRGLETWLFLSKTLSVTLCLTFVSLLFGKHVAQTCSLDLFLLEECLAVQ